jgi:hypothetical protein
VGDQFDFLALIELTLEPLRRAQAEDALLALSDYVEQFPILAGG